MQTFMDVQMAYGAAVVLGSVVLMMVDAWLG